MKTLVRTMATGNFLDRSLRLVDCGDDLMPCTYLATRLRS